MSTAAEASGGEAISQEKRAKVEVLLNDILKLMEFPVRLDVGPMADGAIGVVLHCDGELPGLSRGKRGGLVESLQLLLNKAINRTNGQRCWVALGVEGLPELRRRPGGHRAGTEVAVAPELPASGASAPATNARRVSTARPSAAGTTARGMRTSQVDGEVQRARPDARPDRAGNRDEFKLEVPEDAVFTRVSRSLAEKAGRLGRPYAVMLLSAEDRARVVQAGNGTPGVRLKVEGEQHWRRVVFVPDKPVPMPKRSIMPDWGDEEEE
jgi:predicted RNA-binding protein Jag